MYPASISEVDTVRYPKTNKKASLVLKDGFRNRNFGFGKYMHVFDMITVGTFKCRMVSTMNFFMSNRME